MFVLVLVPVPVFELVDAPFGFHERHLPFRLQLTSCPAEKKVKRLQWSKFIISLHKPIVFTIHYCELSRELQCHDTWIKWMITYGCRRILLLQADSCQFLRLIPAYNNTDLLSWCLSQRIGLIVKNMSQTKRYKLSLHREWTYWFILPVHLPKLLAFLFEDWIFVPLKHPKKYGNFGLTK